MVSPERTVPSNVEAEESVLGSLLIDPEALFRVAPFLTPEDFYIRKNGWIYEAILDLHERREPLDFVTLCSELEGREQLEEVGGAAYVTQLINTVPSAIHVEAYGRLVEQTSLRRNLIGAAGDIAQLAYQEAEEIGQVLDRAEQRLFSISQRRLVRDITPIKDAVRNYYDRIEYLYEHRGEPLGVPTGFIDLDRLLGGLQRSDLIILAARPGVGKTSLALSVARHAAGMDKHVAIFSLEMSAEQLVQRMVSAETGIDAQRLRLGQLEDHEWPLFVQATGVLSDLPVFIDDTPALSALQLRTKARRIHAEHGLDLVVVDYLQLMTGETRNENRVQEVSYISRMSKALARELDVPLLALSQLSRAVEQRTERRPVLSDLRESGCLSGDTLVQLSDGQRVRIRDIATAGRPVEVMALNEKTWKLEPSLARKAWQTGTKSVYRLSTQLGRAVNATANHKFRTVSGWKRLDELSRGDYIALPRSWECLDVCNSHVTKPEAALLGHLIGDGCTLPNHAVQYTTNNYALAKLVADLASQLFGEAVTPRIEQQRNWWQVYLAASTHLTHGVRNPIASWLEDWGVWGRRAYEKYVPPQIFGASQDVVARFLCHLWATDGSMGVFGQKKPRAIVYYATSSRQLALDVQHLLLRLGIISRVSKVPQPLKGRDQWHVTITGKPDVMAFVEKIGVVGPKIDRLEAIRAFYKDRVHNTNRDIIPREAWREIVEPARQAVGISQRAMQAGIGLQYCGSTLFKYNISRKRADQVSQIVQDETLERLSQSDIYWDRLDSIAYLGEEEVFDLEVPLHHNFVADDIVVHNSLEQDADVVMFIYREEMYKPETERQHIADVIVAKHRHGPTDTVQLYFKQQLAQFLDAATRPSVEFS
ncbi:MAG: replicative DNA helicase [Anaerolineae bacterium]|nr:replicative DNA helicase [Anaerolineae bacterium]